MKFEFELSAEEGNSMLTYLQDAVTKARVESVLHPEEAYRKWYKGHADHLYVILTKVVAGIKR